MSSAENDALEIQIDVAVSLARRRIATIDRACSERQDVRNVGFMGAAIGQGISASDVAE